MRSAALLIFNEQEALVKRTYINVISGILLIFCACSAFASTSTCPASAPLADYHWWTVGKPAGNFLEAGYYSEDHMVYCYYGSPDEMTVGFLMSDFQVSKIKGSDWTEYDCKIDGKCYKCSGSAHSCQFASK